VRHHLSSPVPAVWAEPYLKQTERRHG
jgi:hypothetical protein